MTAFGKIWKCLLDCALGIFLVSVLVAAIVEIFGKVYRNVARCLGFELKSLSMKLRH
ncbi:unnamed protein product [Brassica rapa subsp. trilocularis]